MFEFLRSYWAPKPAALTFEGDVVYSSHFMDNQRVYETMVFTTTWFYNDVLDPNMLRTSLSRLLEIGEWRKLGGRFRRPNGRGSLLELHVPAKFTPERPAIGYSTEVIDMNFRDHPLSGGIPDPVDKTLLRPVGKALALRVSPPGTPQTIEDLLRGDRPVLSLHVISFKDATLVTLIWPHALMDAMGVGTLVKTWALVIAGLEAQVPPLSGTGSDSFWEIANSKDAREQQSEIAQTRIGGLGMLIFIFHFLASWVFGPKLTPNYIYISKEKAQRLRSRALEDISIGSAVEDEKPWISEQDALQSVWVNSMALAYSRPRPIILLVPVDVRKRLPGFLDPESTYVENMVVDASCTFSAKLATGPIGSIALYLRRTLQRQTTAPQLLANLHFKRKQWDSKQDMTGFSGPSNSRLLVTTDWSKAKLLHVGDFSAAVIKQGEADEKRENPVGSPFYYQTELLQMGLGGVVNSVVNKGTDHSGGHWYMANLPHHIFKFIEDRLKEI